MQPSKFIQTAIDEHCKQREKYTLKQDIEADDLHPYRLGYAAQRIVQNPSITPGGFTRESWEALAAKPLEQRKLIATAWLISQIEVSNEKYYSLLL